MGFPPYDMISYSNSLLNIFNRAFSFVITFNYIAEPSIVTKRVFPELEILKTTSSIYKYDVNVNAMYSRSCIMMWKVYFLSKNIHHLVNIYFKLSGWCSAVKMKSRSHWKSWKSYLHTNYVPIYVSVITLDRKSPK